jgi:hypothetical protein
MGKPHLGHRRFPIGGEIDGSNLPGSLHRRFARKLMQTLAVASELRNG